MGNGLIKNCEYCRIEFAPVKQVGNRQRFCGESCQRAWWSENWKTASRQFTFVCGNCGKEYQTKFSERNQYCSRECAFEDQKVWGVCPNRIFIDCSNCRNKFIKNSLKMFGGKRYCNDCHSQVVISKCVLCGNEFDSIRVNNNLCSDECRKENARNIILEHDKRNFISKEVICKDCGINFITEYGDKRSKFCSDKCEKRFGKRLRKYRMRGALIKEHITMGYLFERDGRVCYLCQKLIEKELPTLDPFGATIDHVIPISRGGHHSKSNVRLAHRICNSRKGNRLVITQMQLQLQE